MRRQLLTLTLFALAACGDNGSRALDAPERRCIVDCAPYRCDDVRGRCRFTCTGDAQCAVGFTCSDSACIGNECTPETAMQQCGAYACVGGLCITNCSIGACAAGYYCRGDLDICMQRCTRAGDPICDGLRCDTTVGECEPYCLDGELACAAGYRCEAMQCVLDDAAPACGAGCGAYVCVELSGRCATHCADDADCVAPARCEASSCR